MRLKPSTFFSPARVMKDIRAIVSHTRWMTTPEIHKAARYIEKSFRQVPGLTEIQLIDFPADGKTFYGGWVMPKAWNVRGAKLCAVAQNGRAELPLAYYRQNPFSLMMWSPPTPKSGIEAAVVVVEKPFRNG